MLVVVMPFPSVEASAQAPTRPHELTGPGGWSGGPGKARFRIDGIPKVTGARLYARDFHARDLAGWPQHEICALVLRAPRLDRAFCGVNLKALPPGMQPLRAITYDDLQQDGIGELWPDTPGTLLVPIGQPAMMLGQPAAILLFDTAQKFRDAARLLQFTESAFCFGEANTPVPVSQPLHNPLYLTLFTDQFSQAKSGPSDPTGSSPVDKEAAQFRTEIQQRMDTPGWKKFSGSYSTQVVDPMFMEPETGLGWFDAESQTLHLLLGTQATNGDVAAAGSAAGSLFNKSKFPVNTVQLYPCYPGGGFGGRDTSPFLSLLAIAAVYAGQPVRLAYDRFEQFQAGIKRTASAIDLTVAMEPDGKLRALQGSLTLQAGGKINYSPFIADLACYSAGSSYDFTLAAVDSVAMSSIGVTAGSMRGFGGPQAFFAVESLVDEIAVQMGWDPIEFRKRNVLKEGQHTLTGAPLTEPLRLAEICDLAQKHPLWTTRKDEQRQRAGTDLLYGAGFALAMQAYGTNFDGVMAAVAVDAEGAITVKTNCVDMGNGSATTLAISPARWLGANADHITMGEVDLFNKALPLQSGEPDQWNNPNWTAAWALSSSACLTAFHQVHVVEQASQVLFRTGLWPAALEAWGLSSSGGPKPEEARWENGRLAAAGLPALLLRDLARRCHASGGIVEAVVHAVYTSMWISGEYKVGDVTARWPIDALATRQARRDPRLLLRRRGRSAADAAPSAAPAEFTFHPRSNTHFPISNSANYGRTLYAPSGTLVAVEVNRRTGQPKVLAVETFLDAGRVIQADLLSGQSEGGVAMGIGYALLEDLPLELGGAGDGTWNLNRYHVPLGGDVPLDRMKLNVLPALGPDPKGKGIAEAVLCPIAPAIANAIAAATGHRFRSLPITPEKIRQVLAHA